MEGVQWRRARARIEARRQADLAFGSIGLLLLLLAVLTLLTLVCQMAIQGLPRLGIEFLSGMPSRHAAQAGILPAWVGSVAVMAVTAATALPLGVGAAIYLEEYAPRNWLTLLIEINVTTLAGVPSIIYGLMALALFVHGFGLGQSILAAGLTLGLLILPIVIVTTREAMRSVPDAVREAAYACGASTWRTVRDHIVPGAGAGILTGVIVGLARAIGETAPVLTIGALTFIAFLPESPSRGEFPYLSFDWLAAPFTVLPIQTYNWMLRPDPAFRANAAAAGLVLLVTTVAMNLLAIRLRQRLRSSVRW